MDGATLQRRIYAGYARAAVQIGLPYQLFRATGAQGPMAGPPLATLPAAFSPADYAFGQPQNYGKATWEALFDGTQAQVGDVLVGPKTYFVVGLQALLPILAVEAPHIVDVRRPFRETGVGFQAAYGGTTPAQESVIMSQWPASILQGTRGENTMANLPDDLKAPWWGLLMPACPGVEIVTSDVIEDELGRRFAVASAEITPMGWRMTALQEQA
ncbi:MAG: hypothetical protein QOJ54_2901 [Aliidongia sp.]|jgi:hypothetical protein|nr:hypothetical protein [Aliidongia sp.]